MLNKTGFSGIFNHYLRKKLKAKKRWYILFKQNGRIPSFCWAIDQVRIIWKKETRKKVRMIAFDKKEVMEMSIVFRGKFD